VLPEPVAELVLCTEAEGGGGQRVVVGLTRGVR